MRTEHNLNDSEILQAIVLEQKKWPEPSSHFLTIY